MRTVWISEDTCFLYRSVLSPRHSLLSSGALYLFVLEQPAMRVFFTILPELHRQECQVFKASQGGSQIRHLERSVRLNGHSAARAPAEALEQGREHDQLTFIPCDAMKVREALEKNNACV